MELPIHVEPPSPSGPARWIPSVRAVALLTLGVGIGVLASRPFGGDQTNAAIIAILAASAAAALVVLLPRNTLAVGGIVTQLVTRLVDRLHRSTSLRRRQAPSMPAGRVEGRARLACARHRSTQPPPL